MTRVPTYELSYDIDFFRQDRMIYFYKRRLVSKIQQNRVKKVDDENESRKVKTSNTKSVLEVVGEKESVIDEKE